MHDGEHSPQRLSARRFTLVDGQDRETSDAKSLPCPCPAVPSTCEQCTKRHGKRRLVRLAESLKVALTREDFRLRQTVGLKSTKLTGCDMDERLKWLDRQLVCAYAHPLPVRFWITCHECVKVHDTSRIIYVAGHLPCRDADHKQIRGPLTPA